MSTSNNDINTSSSTNMVDDISTDIEKLTTADDGDIISGEEDMSSEKKFTTCEQKLDHTKVDDTSGNNNDNADQNIAQENTGSNLDASDICANCGKEDANNICNKCKQVKYCNALCKKKHKTKHKKDCEEYLKRAAELQEEELRRAAELHDIELFKQPPRDEDCPICFLRLPLLGSGTKYKGCCGKTICSGCIYAMQKRDGGAALCPFCRVPTPETNKEIIKRLQKRVDVGDAEAIHCLGAYFSQGMYDLPQDYTKALELYLRAAELGHLGAYYSIGLTYGNGDGVERDEKKAQHYYELAAMKGYAPARHNLGTFEWNEGHKERALKHWLISVVGGDPDSLSCIQELYSDGDATKDEYAKALRAYQKYLGEIKSSQRDEAAAFDEDYQYIE